MNTEAAMKLLDSVDAMHRRLVRRLVADRGGNLPGHYPEIQEAIAVVHAAGQKDFKYGEAEAMLNDLDKTDEKLGEFIDRHR